LRRAHCLLHLDCQEMLMAVNVGFVVDSGSGGGGRILLRISVFLCEYHSIIAAGSPSPSHVGLTRGLRGKIWEPNNEAVFMCISASVG